MNAHGILVVDDDTRFASGVERYLRARGCSNVRSASQGMRALEMIRDDAPEVVLLDVCMPLMSGLKTLQEIHRINSGIAVFMITGDEAEEYKTLASKLGAAGYLTKPLRMEELYSSIEPCFHKAA